MAKGKSEKLEKSKYYNYLKLSGCNVKLWLKLMPLNYVLTVIVLVTVSFFGFYFVSTLIKISVYFAFLLIPIPIIAVTIFINFKKFLDKKKELLSKLSNAMDKIDGNKITFFDELNFGYGNHITREIVAKLMSSGKLSNDEIIANLLIAKKSLAVTESDAKDYLNARLKVPTRQLVIKFNDVDKNEFCDNCGNIFDPEESFCTHCGTIRKDLRRRI